MRLATDFIPAVAKRATTRDYGWYANRPPRTRGKAERTAAGGPLAIVLWRVLLSCTVAEVRVPRTSAHSEIAVCKRLRTVVQLNHARVRIDADGLADQHGCVLLMASPISTVVYC